MATIHGIQGQHAQDLIARGIIAPNPSQEHLVLVPVTQTKALIRNLLDHYGVPQTKVVNFSWVMCTSPNATPNIHFLFGPWAQTNLHAVTAGTQTHLVRKVLDKASNQGIAILETSHIEHDRIMAVIQWLTHLLLVVLGLQKNPHTHEKLIAPWKTSTSTIVDMIFENPFAEEVAIDFFEALMRDNSHPFRVFTSIVEKYLPVHDRERFSTPNFARVYQSGNEEVVIPKKQIALIRKNLNTNGRTFLRSAIDTIRSAA